MILGAATGDHLRLPSGVKPVHRLEQLARFFQFLRSSDEIAGGFELLAGAGCEITLEIYIGRIELRGLQRRFFLGQCRGGGEQDEEREPGRARAPICSDPVNHGGGRLATPPHRGKRD